MADNTRTWLMVHTKGSKQMRQRLNAAQANNPEYQKFLKDQGLGAGMSKAKTQTAKKPTQTSTDDYDAPHRKAARRNLSMFGGSGLGGFQMPGSSFNRYNEYNEAYSRESGGYKTTVDEKVNITMGREGLTFPKDKTARSSSALQTAAVRNRLARLTRAARSNPETRQQLAAQKPVKIGGQQIAAQVNEEHMSEEKQKHVVNVTVSDPNHPMVSKRKETISRRATVSADSRESAVQGALKFYRRQGLKVHDHNYVGLKEEVEQMHEASSPGVHDLSHMSDKDAYDETQTNDEIKHGHILILSRGRMGVMHKAWPTLVHGSSDLFHKFNQNDEEGKKLHNAAKEHIGNFFRSQLSEVKQFRTAYGWAGGRNERTGGTYKHPDQIEADRKAKKKAKQKPDAAQVAADERKNARISDEDKATLGRVAELMRAQRMNEGNRENKDKKKKYVRQVGLNAMRAGEVDPARGHSPTRFGREVLNREEIEQVDEAKMDNKHPIVIEYESMKKMGIKAIRDLLKQQHRIIDTSEYKNKDHAISDYLRNKHGNKRVAAAFGLEEEVEQVDEEKDLTNRLKKSIESKGKHTVTRNKSGTLVLRKAFPGLDSAAKTGMNLSVRKEEVEQVEEGDQTRLDIRDRRPPGVSYPRGNKPRRRNPLQGLDQESDPLAVRQRILAGHGLATLQAMMRREEVEQVDEQSPAVIRAQYYHDQFDKVKPVKAYDEKGNLVGHYRSMAHAKRKRPGHTYKTVTEAEGTIAVTPKEEVEYIEEKLTAADSASTWIRDFVDSDNPKFAGKSNKERRDMALGAYYAAQRSRNEEVVQEKLDPVGSETADINNDQKVDKTDDYLRARRQTINKAIAKKKGM